MIKAYGLKADWVDCDRALIYTDNQMIPMKLWESGLCGEQSAERGPVMTKVRDLVWRAFLDGKLHERARGKV